jgi:hypothetical protein
MATGTIFTLHGHCDPAYTTFTFDSVETDKKFNHGAAFVAPVVAFMQPLPGVRYARDDTTPLAFAVDNTSSIDGLINHITEEFVIETRYPEGQVPAPGSYSINDLKAAAISEINTAFGLSLA